jgi:dihydrofolate reductase
MKAIIAVNNLGFIGIGDTLPWRSSEDLRHFKSMTQGCKLLVGHRTFSTLPPLKNREVILDEREIETFADWCIGGKKTYEKYAKYFTELHISHIDDNTIGDVTFPDFSSLNPHCKIYNYRFSTNL